MEKKRMENKSKTYEQKRETVKEFMYPVPSFISEEEWVEALYRAEMEYRSKPLFWKIRKFVLYNLLGLPY